MKNERTAYHEAGHVVMSYLLRRRFSYVTIDENELAESVLGRVGGFSCSKHFFDDIECSNDDATQRIIEREISILLAGLVAEWLLTGRKNWIGANSDVDKINELLSRWFCDDEVANAYFKYVLLCVRNKFRHRLHWAYVEAVAQALLQHRRLGYRKAHLVIAETRAKLLPKVDFKRIRTDLQKKMIWVKP